MDVQDYISSGILESYVLGFCSPQEVEEVERLISEHASVREEIRVISEGLEKVASQAAVNPPEHLKHEIWKAIQEDTIIDIAANAEPERTYNDPVIGKQPMSGTTWLKYAASFALIFGTSSLAVFFYSRSNQIENQLASVKETNKSLQVQMDKSRDSLAQIHLKMNLLADAGTKKVNLAGMPNSQDSKAVVFWNAGSQKVILTDLSLPKAPSDKQYQLWALVDGVPVDAGVFDYTAENNLIDMKSIGKSQAFAITLEPKGGSVSPHLETLCVMGNV